MSDDQQGLSAEELGSEGATALPDKEVVSILDLNADIDLAIDAAAPIDLAVAANANVAAPIDAAVGANMLSVDSTAQALSDQGVIINQGIDADANAPRRSRTARSTRATTSVGAGTATTDPAADPPPPRPAPRPAQRTPAVDPVLGGAGDGRRRRHGRHRG